MEQLPCGSCDFYVVDYEGVNRGCNHKENMSYDGYKAKPGPTVCNSSGVCELHSKRYISLQEQYKNEIYDKLPKLTAEIGDELYKAACENGKYNSAHKGWAVIQEKLDELWEEVKKKKSKRDTDLMRHKAIQIASTAIMFIIDICNKE